MLREKWSNFHSPQPPPRQQTVWNLLFYLWSSTGTSEVHVGGLRSRHERKLLHSVVRTERGRTFVDTTGGKDFGPDPQRDTESPLPFLVLLDQ